MLEIELLGDLYTEMVEEGPGPALKLSTLDLLIGIRLPASYI